MSKLVKLSDGSQKFNLENLEKLKTERRISFIKNSATNKNNNSQNVEIYCAVIRGNFEEKVRKEAVSALGRQRDFNVAKKYLIPLLKDNNPEIVLQAIRGLLVFKEVEEVHSELFQVYETAENELVQYVLDKEFGFSKLDFDTKKNHIDVSSKYKNKIVNGDTINIMKKMDRNSIHLTFTSPPYYNARDYSIYKSYQDYLDFLENTFAEIHRITKDGRFLVVNTSPIIIPRVGRKYASRRYPIPYDLHSILTKIGWEFIDDIVWVKPEAAVKNRIGGFLQFKKPLMYKPNAITEQIMVYRKKSNRLIDWSIKAYSEEIVDESKVGEIFEHNNVWRIDPTFDKTHSAVFPYKLCDNIVKYYSFVGDLVFDPFAGSGTLAQAALDDKRNIFMTEINQKYFDRIKERLALYDVMFLKESEFK